MAASTKCAGGTCTKEWVKTIKRGGGRKRDEREDERINGREIEVVRDHVCLCEIKTIQNVSLVHYSDTYMAI